MMRIGIHGAGLIGCYVGGHWAASGCEVTFLGRSSIQQEISEHGLTLTAAKQDPTYLSPDQITYETDPACLKKVDMIVLAVKCIGLEAAADEIGAHAPSHVPVLSLLNGVSAADRLSKQLKGYSILRGMVPFNVARTGPGIFHKASAGHVTVEQSEWTSKLAHNLETSYAKLDLRDDMSSILWGKLLLNLNNAVCALSGSTLKMQLSDRGYRKALAALIDEALNTLALANITPAQVGGLPPARIPGFLRLPDWIFRPIGLRIQKIDAKARSSMAEDLENQRPTEVDFLNGEVVALARSLGRDAPLNAKIVELVHAREAGTIGAVSSANLLSALNL